jgi:hypothetical protein
MDTAAIEADILRCKRQLEEVRNPETATRLRARLALLEHQRDTLGALARQKTIRAGEAAGHPISQPIEPNVPDRLVT